MTRFDGLLHTPAAAARRTNAALEAIDDALTALGVDDLRVEFPGQAAGRPRPDPPAVCFDTIRGAAEALARELGVPQTRIGVGGRSFGGRMCSMAVAEGLTAAGLVLVSYPLHPPGRPDRLRTAHFGSLRVPCLFVSGRRDAFATPAELARETAAIPGTVTVSFLDGDHSLRRKEREVADLVAGWVRG